VLHSHTGSYQGLSKFFAPCTPKPYASTTTSTLSCMKPCTTTSPSLCTATTRHPVAQATSTSPCTTSTCLPAAAALPQLRRACGCLGTSRRSSSTTPPRAGSSSTTSTPPRVRVPRHVARLVTWLVAPLVVDYSASRRLIVDYFASAARPGASACRAARHAARRAARHRLLRLVRARRRLLRLRRASGCLSTSLGSSRRSSSTTPPHAGSSSTTPPTPHVRVPRLVARLVTRLVAPLVVDYSTSHRLIVDYFASAARPGASARRAARHADRRVAHRRLLRLAQARRRLLRLRRASGCLGSSRGSLRHSSSTTSPTPRVQVPRHVARPVTQLIVDYSVRRDFVLRPRWLYFNHTVRGDYLSRGNTGSTSSTPCTTTTSSSGRIASTIHLD
jgi:hypothetical protein